MPLFVGASESYDTDAWEAYNLKKENVKLRNALKALMMGTNVELCAYRGELDCKGCSMHHGEDGCTVVDAMELLGIDMYGEPLRAEEDL